MRYIYIEREKRKGREGKRVETEGEKILYDYLKHWFPSFFLNYILRSAKFSACISNICFIKL